MEFGKLESVENIDWSLPPEDSLTQPFLTSLNTKQTEFYLGAPAWGRKEWIGRLYPPGTRSADFLFHYSRNFNCIELNTTHYRIPAPGMVQGWIEKVPEGFLFCPKIPKTISHEHGGLLDSETLSLWFESLDAFGKHLGPSFLQLPPMFSYANKSELFHFLKSWPDEFPLTLEFRHSSWFENGHILAPLVEYLQQRRIGLVITDVAGRRDVLHSSISAPFSMLRFIGNDLHDSDFTRAEAWAKRISQWKSYGLKQFFFMVHEPDDIKTPEMADWLVNELNQTCGAGLMPLAKPLL